ncbi:MAG: hypothetical protein ABSA75_06775 [Candidatus Bathyarchaeia archaeon]|jgi:hypothetical protein
MAIGEKLWEGKAKTMGMAIKGASAEGVSMEYTWMAQVKGMGKAKGVDGNIMFTGNTMISPTGGGGSMGTGLLTTMTGDMAVIKGSGYGKPEGGKGKGVALWNFMTMSPKLAWLNMTVALTTQEGDPQWQEFDLVVWEWK